VKTEIKKRNEELKKHNNELKKIMMYYITALFFILCLRPVKLLERPCLRIEGNILRNRGPLTHGHKFSQSVVEKEKQ